MAIIIITVCITVLELYALSLGHDGKILLTVIGTLCTIAGWQGKKAHLSRRKRKYEKFAKFAADLDRRKENKNVREI